MNPFIIQAPLCLVGTQYRCYFGDLLKLLFLKDFNTRSRMQALILFYFFRQKERNLYYFFVLCNNNLLNLFLASDCHSSHTNKQNSIIWNAKQHIRKANKRGRNAIVMYRQHSNSN